MGLAWRRSLQLRVVVLTLGLSLAVILVLGFVLTSQITDRILEVKVRAATEEIERARNTVSGIVGGEETRSLDSSLQLARNTLIDRKADAGAGLAGAFDAVLVVPGDGPRAATAAGPVQQVPNALRDFVKAGQVSYQYATVRTDGFSGPALIIGSPTSSPVTNLELYLIFPLNNEESTISLVRGTMVTGGVVLLLMLAAIALIVARQIVLPVRSASRIAERFAEGHLTERMPVRGEDDMARLAVSFNDMAESLSRQITQLEEFGNLQRRFTSDVSHELRTPLTTVRMAADLIYDHSEDLDPALRRSTELMVSELDRFETLLNDLLEISRHDAGVAELSVEAVDLRVTVQSALDNVGHLAGDAQIELIVDMPTEEVIAEVDPRRVERILRNLIANAIDHAERKPVRIRMARRRRHRRRHRARLRRRAAARRGEAGVQPVLALRPVAGAPLRRYRPRPGDQHRGRPAAPGQAGGVGRTRQGRLLPAHPAAGARPQGDDQPAAAETRWARTQAAASARRARTGGRERVKRVLASPGRGCSRARRGALAGCAGVPSSSAPQAIGTVDRPAPPSLPKPTPGMDPDVLLREFLKATADPVQPASGRAAVPHRIGLERAGTTRVARC